MRRPEVVTLLRRLVPMPNLRPAVVGGDVPEPRDFRAETWYTEVDAQQSFRPFKLVVEDVGDGAMVSSVRIGSTECLYLPTPARWFGRSYEFGLSYPMAYQGVRVRVEVTGELLPEDVRLVIVADFLGPSV